MADLLKKPFHITEAIHVIVITYNRTSLLRRCLESILAELTQLQSEIHIHVRINGADKDSESLVQRMEQENTNCKWYINGSETALSPSSARNVLLKGLTSGWVLFIDDDAYLPPGYGPTFLAQVECQPWAMLLGGPNLAPPKQNYVSEITSYVLSSYFGSGPFRRRYEVLTNREVQNDHDFILCHMWVKLSQAIQFPEDIIAGEENILVQNLIKQEHRGFYCGKLFVYHERRQTFNTLSRQIFRYGIGRAEIIKKQMSSVRTFTPLLALVPLFLISVFLWINPLSLQIVLFVYIAMLVTSSLLVVIRSKKTGFFFLALVLYPLIHVCYFAGASLGLLGSISKSKTVSDLFLRNS